MSRRNWNIHNRGILSGQTTLTVTDNRTQEQCNLNIKVVDHYEVLRLSQNLYSTDKNYAPLPLNAEFLYLIDNKDRDAYFFGNGASTRVTSSDLILQGKGKYSFSEAEGKHYLTLTYQEDKVQISRNFLLNSNEYALHRLDKYLHLDWNTPAGEYEEINAFLLLKETDSGKELGTELITFEMPNGILP